MGLAQVLVVVVDDHEPGQLGFEKRFYNVKETDEFAIVPVCRTCVLMCMS